MRRHSYHHFYRRDNLLRSVLEGSHLGVISLKGVSSMEVAPRPEPLAEVGMVLPAGLAVASGGVLRTTAVNSISSDRYSIAVLRRSSPASSSAIAA